MGNPVWTVHELVKSDSQGPFTRGDTVRFNGDTYEFVSFVTNIVNGKQWVDLWGGPPRHQQWVHCQVEQIIKVDKKRKP